MSKQVPVLYLMEPIGVDGGQEAVETLFFCSEECRYVIQQNTAHTVDSGMNGEYVTGTVCDECGKPLE